jgi:hypothetical protein
MKKNSLVEEAVSLLRELDNPSEDSVKSYKNLTELSRDILANVGPQNWRIGEKNKDEYSIRLHPKDSNSSVESALGNLKNNFAEFSKKSESFSEKYDTYESIENFKVGEKEARVNLIFAVIEDGALKTGKLIGFGAEWAVWCALAEKSLKDAEVLEKISNDKRINTAFSNSSEKEKNNFLDTLNTMSESFKDSFIKEKFGGWSGRAKYAKEPVSSTGEADVEATDSEDKEFVFHIKYRSERIGSIPLKNKLYSMSGKEGKTASEIYRDLRPAGKFAAGEISTFKESLKNNDEFVKSLIFGVKKKLGIGGAGGSKHILVNFKSSNSFEISTLGTQKEVELSIEASAGEITNPAFHVKTQDGKIVANVEIHPETYGSGRRSGKFLQIHKGPDFSSLFEGQKIDEFSGAGAVAGVSVPLGKNASGKPEGRPASKVLKKNADIYGKSWGGAKPLKEAIELLGILREEKDQ